jgi:hypothetical protein
VVRIFSNPRKKRKKKRMAIQTRQVVAILGLAVWHGIICPVHATTSPLSILSTFRPNTAATKLQLDATSWRLQVRGGSTATVTSTEDNDDEEKKEDITQSPQFADLQKYRMQQQVLLQLRATFLSEALAERGLPLATLAGVSTPEGAKPPQSVDWDCAMSTPDEPKPCLYSFDAEPYTKVLAPLNTQNKWISISALNRLRRADSSKVEPMWSSQYAVLAWFDADSEYSLLQHVGAAGFLLNSLLQGYRLHLALGYAIVVAAVICMPILEYCLNRFLVSGFLWSTYASWGRFAHAALPLKLLMGQYLFKLMAHLFGKLVGVVKERLVDLECQILESRIPLTVGPGSEVVEGDDGMAAWDDTGEADDGDSEESDDQLYLDEEE